MKLIRHLYKTKNLAENGIYILLLLILLLIVGHFFIPVFKVQKTLAQQLTLNGIALKYDDDPSVSLFLQSIKSNQGYLCLGTSESTDLPNGNYWNFLNNDTSLRSRFSVLSGAGRTCGLYIPILLSHQHEVDSLQLIYFINPVYWRTDLADVNPEYWNRYSNYKMCKEIHLSAEEKKLYYAPVQAYFDKLTIIEKINFTLEYEIRKYRKHFFQDLRYDLKPDEFLKTLTFIANDKIALNKFKNFGEIDPATIDTNWNIQYSFKNKEWFKPIDKTKNYRYKELQTFIYLCRKLGIKTTFVVGPYNGRFISRYDKKSLHDYQQTTEKIKAMLENEKADFIDATDISFKAGAFIDHQHHSSYGAFLIYQKIKSQLNEKGND